MQLPNTSATRPSVLGALVHARQGVALQLLLLGLALEPIRGLNLAPARWAQMLRFRSRPVSTTQVLRAVGQLQERGLVDQGASRRGLELNLLREDASRQPYTRPAGGEGGKGYFLLPHRRCRPPRPRCSRLRVCSASRSRSNGCAEVQQRRRQCRHRHQRLCDLPTHPLPSSGRATPMGRPRPAARSGMPQRRVRGAAG